VYRLHQSFVKAIRDSHLTLVQLAALAEYSSQNQLSFYLNSKFKATPLALRRLRLIADVVGYDDAALIEEVRRG
jgi:hypothetical protein